MFKVPLGVSTALLTAEISLGAFELGMCCFWWNYKKETLLFWAIIPVFIAVRCQVGLFGRQNAQISTHILREQQEPIAHILQYPIIPGNNYSTGPSPTAQLMLVTLLFLILKTKIMQSSQMLNILWFKKGFFFALVYVCTHVTSDSVNHAALWMFPVAKRCYLSHSSANWPEWPMRSGWTSTASAHLLHSSVGRNLVKDYEQIQKCPPPLSTIDLAVTLHLIVETVASEHLYLGYIYGLVI